MKILKQILDITGEATYELPGSSINLLSVQEQENNIVLYYMSDIDAYPNPEKAPTKKVKILIVWTGYKRRDLKYARYIGSVVPQCGPVRHCFVKERP